MSLENIFLSLQEFNASFRKIFNQIKSIKFEHGNLENYSPWFSAFQSDAMDYSMEIPGSCYITSLLH